MQTHCIGSLNVSDFLHIAKNICSRQYSKSIVDSSNIIHRCIVVTRNGYCELYRQMGTVIGVSRS